MKTKGIILSVLAGVILIAGVAFAVSSSFSDQAGTTTPVLSEISPTEGAVGDEIVLTGTDLDAVSTVLLEPREGSGIGIISERLFSVDEASEKLTFTFPGSLSHEDCRPQSNEVPCPEIAILAEVGVYDVSVLTEDLTKSEALTFTLTRTTDEGDEPDRNDLSVVFADALFKTAVEINDGRMPIEGYTPDMLIDTFSGLEKRHFAGVEAEQGFYTYDQAADALAFTFTAEDDMRHSAAEAISSDGYATLFSVLQTDYGVIVNTRDDVQPFIDTHLVASTDSGDEGLTFAVETDKGAYASGETIEITVTATNETDQTKELEWMTGCQSSYTVGSFDSTDGRMCTQAITNITIPAGESHSWTHSHDLSEHQLSSGTHTLIGRVDGYGSAETQLTVE